MDLNNEAFDIVSLITKKRQRKVSDQKPGSSEHISRVDLSHVKFPNVPYKVYDVDTDSVVGYYFDYEETQIGYDQNNYPTFLSFTKKVSELAGFKDLLSQEYIEGKCFDWCYQVYSIGSSKEYLIDFIERLSAGDVHEFEFCYPITGLTIEKDFEIGHVQFTFFTKEKMDEMRNLHGTFPKPISDEHFDSIFRTPFQGHVLAKTTSTAEYKKAEALAKEAISMSVDVLKLYSRAIEYPVSTEIFEACFKLNYTTKYDYLTKKNNEASYSVGFKYNRPESAHFSRSKIENLLQNELLVFSNFIKEMRDDEFNKLIKQAISMFGAALVNQDLHYRCVQIITILESLFLKEEREKNMSNKVKKRIARFFTDDLSQKEEIKELIDKIYTVRHKMIHKAIRLDIDTVTLRAVQAMIKEILLSLIKLSIAGYVHKNRLIEEIDHALIE